MHCGVRVILWEVARTTILFVWDWPGQTHFVVSSGKCEEAIPERFRSRCTSPLQKSEPYISGMGVGFFIFYVAMQYDVSILSGAIDEDYNFEF